MATSHQLHRIIGKGPGWLTLYMTDYGTDSPSLADMNGTVRIHLSYPRRKSIVRELTEAEDFAAMAETFGRPGIARIIRELAEIGKETGAPQAR
jgi:hypothetical protein